MATTTTPTVPTTTYPDNSPLGVHLRELKKSRDVYIANLNQSIFPELQNRQADKVASKILGLANKEVHVQPGLTGSHQVLDGGYVIGHSIKQGLEWRHFPGYETYK